MNRSETLKHPDELTEFTDSEIARNAEFIRQLAQQAHIHINILRGDRDKIKRQLAKEEKEARFWQNEVLSEEERADLAEKELAEASVYVGQLLAENMMLKARFCPLTEEEAK